jgi:hypothetical protein
MLFAISMAVCTISPDCAEGHDDRLSQELAFVCKADSLCENAKLTAKHGMIRPS